MMREAVKRELEGLLEDEVISAAVYNKLCKVTIEINPEDLQVFIEYAIRNRKISKVEKISYENDEQNEKLQSMGFDGAFVVNDSYMYAWNYGCPKIRNVTSKFNK